MPWYLRKKIWIMLSFVILLTIAGFISYQYFFNRDISAEAVHVSEEFFDFSTVLDDINSDTLTNSNQAVSQHQIQNETNEPIENTPSSQTQSGTSPKNQSMELASSPQNKQPTSKDDKSDIQLTEDMIESKYYPKFDRLKNLTLTRLDQLYVNGHAEYVEAKKTGNPPISNVVSRYSSAAKKLQKQVDITFNVLIEQMKNDLESNGLPMDLAIKAEETYHNLMKQKKAELLDRAMND